MWHKFCHPLSQSLSSNLCMTCASDKSFSVFPKASLLGDLNAPTLSSATVIADVKPSLPSCKLLMTDLDDSACPVLRTSTKIEVSMSSFIPALFVLVLSRILHYPPRIPKHQQLILQYPLQASSFPSPYPVSNGGFYPTQLTSVQFPEYSCVPFTSYPVTQHFCPRLISNNRDIS